MKHLIIYAHPDHESNSKFTLTKVKESLDNKKESYEVLDLYQMKFNPILSYEEMYDKKIPQEVSELQKKVTESDHLIFVYPIWWNGMPAIMKGFIDRVFAAGFAFKYDKGMPKGLLKGKKATIFVSTGSNKIISYMFLGNRFKTVVAKDTLEFCGIKAQVYHTDSARELTDKQMKKIEHNVKCALK